MTINTRILGILLAPFVLGSSVTSAQTTLFIDSEPGDYIGGGVQATHTPGDATFTVNRIGNTVYVSVEGPDGRWDLSFGAPGDAVLVPGRYAPAFRPGPGVNGVSTLNVAASGRSCSALTGRFDVLEIAYDGDGTLLLFAADIEQHCEDFGPALFASVRYNSSLDPQPFDGLYPRYELALTEPAHGKVTGEGVECGGGAIDCAETFAVPRIVALTAQPDPGYIFTGWGGACNGGPAMTVKVNTVKQCDATFAPDPPALLQKLLYWESTPGDYLGEGDSDVYSGENSRWTLTSMGNGNGVRVVVSSAGDTSESRWTLDFSAPLGAVLAVGSYPEAAKTSSGLTSAGLDVSGNGRSCSTVSGNFTVHEIVIDPPSGAVAAFAVDFEQHCGDLTKPALFGTLRYNSSVALPLRSVSLTSDLILPVVANTAVTWTASAHPGVAVEYSFWRFDEGVGWDLVQSYGPSAVYLWTPTSADAGQHSLQVWARKVGSTAVYETWSGQTFSINPIPGPSISLSLRSPALVGTPVMFSASAAGGLAPYEFQFWRLDGQAWHMVQDYSTLNTYTWTPAAPDAGAHALQVWVRNAGSIAPYDAYRALAFEVVEPDPVRVTLAADVVFPAVAGRPITWMAAATGGVKPLLYQFWRLDSDGWKVVRDYSVVPGYTWTPSAADAGEHALQVWVRSAGSSAAYDAYTGVTFTLTPPAPVTSASLTATPTLPAPAGTSITWTADGIGGVSPLQYQFWRLDANGWNMVRDYGTDSSYTWTPGVADVGEHAIQVWVRSSGSTAAYEAWCGTTFAVTEPVININLFFTNFATSPFVGQLVEFNGGAMGGVQPLQYQFWRLDDDGWHLAQDYSPSGLYTWTATPGDHAVQVWIRNLGSTNAYDAWTGTGMFTVR